MQCHCNNVRISQFYNVSTTLQNRIATSSFSVVWEILCMEYIYHYTRSQKSITENPIISFQLSLRQQVNDKKKRVDLVSTTIEKKKRSVS